MLGKTLAQYCPDDSAMAKAQKRIEKELADFEKSIWGNPAKKDSLDSIAKTAPNVKVKKKTDKTNRRATAKQKETKVKTKSSSSSSSGSSSGGSARVTVRRQRH